MTCREQREREKELILKKKIVLEQHRQFWNYIADESERTGTFINHLDACQKLWPEDDWPPMFKIGCNLSFGGCVFCPVEWEGKSYKCCSDSVYKMMEADSNKDLPAYIQTARDIANLPERKYRFERSWTDVFAVAVLCAGIVMYILAMFQ